MSRKHPCSACPFRKTAAAGWIGGHSDPAEITTIVFDEERKFPCHMHVNELQAAEDPLAADFDEDDDLDDPVPFELAVELADHCVGALICMNNSGKFSRDRLIGEQQKALGKSDDVFATRHDFVAYHRNFRESMRQRLASQQVEPAEPAQSAVKGVRRAKQAVRQKRNDAEAAPDNPRPSKRTAKPKTRVRRRKP